MDGFYCNFTSYIHSDNRAVVAEAIINLLEQQEGCHLFQQLPYLMIDTGRLRQRDISKRPPLLIVGLGIGRDGWTSMKTYPNEWLFLRAPGSNRPRLSSLAMQLGCDAFFYRVVNDLDGLLLETNATGSFRFDSTLYPQFSLIKVPESFHESMRVNQDPEIVRKKAEYDSEFNRQKAEGKLNLQLLAAILDELQEGDAERIDIALAKTIDSFQGRWYCFDLFYEIYANFQELEEMNVQLLYFQPPDNYLRTLPVCEVQPEEYWDEEEF